MAFCENRGTQMQDAVKFCSACGKEVGVPEAAKVDNAKLDNLYNLARRAREEANVAQGLKYYKKTR